MKYTAEQVAFRFIYTNLSSLFIRLLKVKCVYMYAYACSCEYKENNVRECRVEKNLEQIHFQVIYSQSFFFWKLFPHRQPNLPSKRLELTLNKFTTVALPLHLNVINQHAANIERVSNEARQDLLIYIRPSHWVIHFLHSFLNKSTIQ